MAFRRKRYYGNDCIEQREGYGTGIGMVWMEGWRAGYTGHTVFRLLTSFLTSVV